MDPQKFQQIQVASVQELNSWLNQNYKSEESYWLVTFKKEVKEKYISIDEVLDLLIAFGWIDGIRKKLDNERTMQLICRRKNHIWAKTYKDRANKLIEEGKMHEGGFDSISYSKANNLWDALNEVDELVIPPDLEKALINQSGTTEQFEKYAPSYRRNILRWLATTKFQATRDKRIARIIDFTSRLEKIPNY